MQLVLDRFVATARHGDRAGFGATFSVRDPSLGNHAREIFDNLQLLPLTMLTATVQPGPRPVSDARRTVLGADAWRQAVLLRWRLMGDDASAEHTVWLSFVRDGAQTLIAGTTDQPVGETAPLPSWWVGPVETGAQGTVTVVVGSGQSVSTWLRRAGQAQAQVARWLPPGTGYPSQGPLVLEVPATTADFAAVVGTPPGAVDSVAATTMVAGTPTSALRVVVNPDASRRLTSEGLAVTVTHEVVHVRTRSAASPAPTWIIEGLAEEVALRASPEVAPLVAAPVLDAVEQDGPPEALPDDTALDPAAPQVGLAYGQSWLACRFVSDAWGRAELGRLYRGLDQGQNLDEAVDSALGIPAVDFLSRWRADLTARTRRR